MSERQGSLRGAVPRALFTLGGSAVLAAGLGGCIVNYDSFPPPVKYVNEYAEDVVVYIEYPNGDNTDTLVRAGLGAEQLLDDCQGTGFSVVTTDGVELGHVTQQACPNWQLTIDADGSLTYEERMD